MKKIPIPTLLTASIVVLVLLVYALTFEVRFSEVAVKVRLGQVAAIVKQPGLYPRWPWPIESIKKYDRRLRTLDTTEAEIKTKDGKNVIMGNYAVWQIENPNQFYVRVNTIAKADEYLRARITQRRAAVIGNEDLSAFVNPSEDVVNASFDRISQELLHGRRTEAEDQNARSLYDSVLADFGIRLEKVAIRRISLPEETTKSVFQQMSAERQAEAARYREEGKAVAQKLTSEADAARKSILAFADRKASEESAKGVQASTGILSQIASEDTDFFIWLRWLEALRTSLKQKSTIFLDNDSELFKRFTEPPPRVPGDKTAAGG
jgi:membrane protease subunit HflC